MTKKLLVSLVITLVAVALALPANAQELASALVVSDQASVNGMVNITSVSLPQSGFVVIHADNGAGAPGDAIGFLPLASGTYSNVWVPIDVTLATPLLFAMLHSDDGAIGTYEFGTVEGADAPIVVDGAPVIASFNAAVILAFDQFVADGQFAVASVTAPQDGWLVVHADESGTPGPVLAYTAVPAGTTTNLSIPLSGDVTRVVWPMLHADTGAAGEFEFGTVEGADGPVSVGNQAVELPVWTAPHVRAYDQPLGDSNQLWFSYVLLDQPGWVVIHADENGAPGAVLGYSDPLQSGLSTNVTVTIDPSAVGSTVWAMLHYDTGEVGVYEFGTVEGADVPVLEDGNSPVMSSLKVLPPAPPPRATRRGPERDDVAHLL